MREMCGIIFVRGKKKTGDFMSKQTDVKISDETFNRLKILSERTGRTTAYYIREAIQEHLDDLEDIYFSESAIGDLLKGKDEILGHKDFWKNVES